MSSQWSGMAVAKIFRQSITPYRAVCQLTSRSFTTNPHQLITVMYCLMCWWSCSVACTYFYICISIITTCSLYGHQGGHGTWIRPNCNLRYMLTMSFDSGSSRLITPFPSYSSRPLVLWHRSSTLATNSNDVLNIRKKALSLFIKYLL